MWMLSNSAQVRCNLSCYGLKGMEAYIARSEAGQQRSIHAVTTFESKDSLHAGDVLEWGLVWVTSHSA